MERRYQLIVVAVAAIVYLSAIPAPPNLMDDVDAVQAQIARNMLESGDWVTARLNGVAYLEKSPLIYWLIAGSFAIFGVHDWAARLPLALGVVALAWVTARFAAWAYGARAGLASGLAIATCVGLWLFTRIQIPDALLTLAIAIALWGWLRALEGERRWAYFAWAAIGAGLLLKALIATLFPVASLTIYLAVSGEWRKWRSLRPFTGLALTLAIAAPWHIAAALANPPLWDFTMRSAPGEYHGFFWFYFLNEHVFRFLNMRYPRDYNTVPRVLFWAFHLLWLFPWIGALAGVRIPAGTRARRVTILAFCWIGFVLAFFTLSTTQEYYSMPTYPAFALLIGLGVSRGHTLGLRVAGGVFALAGLVIAFLLASVWNTPAPGDIAQALTSNPDAYTLSLGHMGDLTIQSFAYLKLPLFVSLIACAVGALATRYAPITPLTIAMAIFLHAARLALIAFDPYLGSRELADAYRAAPPGELIVDNQYYTFSSVFFYANVERVWLLNGRKTNLEYGSYAPGAPPVFIDDARFEEMWREPKRYYVLIEKPELARIQKLAGGRENLILEKASGGKFLFKNR
ncbi:MAG: glycosyltransferase family 39 protein [Bryobacteraceae bacterium]|nr:glycosyltransferase family 39 protein [Bryobacteraceae bacterium]